MTAEPEGLLELPTLELRGTPQQLGEGFGEACREQIGELYAIRLRWARLLARTAGARVQESDVLEWSRRSLAVCADYDPAGTAELEGIARGARLEVEQVFALGALTDLIDGLCAEALLPDGWGCSGFVRSGLDPMLAQTWDLFTDNLPHVILVHRKPDEGLQTWSLTVHGGLSMTGFNEAGVACGTTNLQTRDARPGVPYLHVLHRVLGCRDLESATAAVCDAPRAGGHSYSLASAEGAARIVECSATRAVVFDVDGVRAQTNHAHSDAVRELELQGVRASSSVPRYTRLRALLDAGIDTAEAARVALGDHGDAEAPICRHHDANRVSTNACVVIRPAAGELFACRGQAHRGAWVQRGFH